MDERPPHDVGGRMMGGDNDDYDHDGRGRGRRGGDPPPPPPPPPGAGGPSSSPSTAGGSGSTASAVADTLRRYLDLARSGSGDRGGGGGGGRRGRPSPPSTSAPVHRRRQRPPTPSQPRPRHQGDDRHRHRGRGGGRGGPKNNEPLPLLPRHSSSSTPGSPAGAGQRALFDPLQRLASVAAAAPASPVTPTENRGTGAVVAGIRADGGDTRRFFEEEEADDDVVGVLGGGATMAAVVTKTTTEEEEQHELSVARAALAAYTAGVVAARARARAAAASSAEAEGGTGDSSSAMRGVDDDASAPAGSDGVVDRTVERGTSSPPPPPYGGGASDDDHSSSSPPSDGGDDVDVGPPPPALGRDSSKASSNSKASSATSKACSSPLSLSLSVMSVSSSRHDGGESDGRSDDVDGHGGGESDEDHHDDDVSKYAPTERAAEGEGAQVRVRGESSSPGGGVGDSSPSSTTTKKTECSAITSKKVEAAPATMPTGHEGTGIDSGGPEGDRDSMPPPPSTRQRRPRGEEEDDEDAPSSAAGERGGHRQPEQDEDHRGSGDTDGPSTAASAGDDVGEGAGPPGGGGGDARPAMDDVTDDDDDDDTSSHHPPLPHPKPTTPPREPLRPGIMEMAGLLWSSSSSSSPPSHATRRTGTTTTAVVAAAPPPHHSESATTSSSVTPAVSVSQGAGGDDDPAPPSPSPPSKSKGIVTGVVAKGGAGVRDDDDGLGGGGGGTHATTRSGGDDLTGTTTETSAAAVAAAAPPPDATATTEGGSSSTLPPLPPTTTGGTSRSGHDAGGGEGEEGDDDEKPPPSPSPSPTTPDPSSAEAGTGEEAPAGFGHHREDDGDDDDETEEGEVREDHGGDDDADVAATKEDEENNHPRGDGETTTDVEGGLLRAARDDGDTSSTVPQTPPGGGEGTDTVDDTPSSAAPPGGIVDGGAAAAEEDADDGGTTTERAGEKPPPHGDEGCAVCVGGRAAETTTDEVGGDGVVDRHDDGEDVDDGADDAEPEPEAPNAASSTTEEGGGIIAAAAGEKSGPSPSSRPEEEESDGAPGEEVHGGTAEEEGGGAASSSSSSPGPAEGDGPDDGKRGTPARGASEGTVGRNKGEEGEGRAGSPADTDGCSSRNPGTGDGGGGGNDEGKVEKGGEAVINVAEESKLGGDNSSSCEYVPNENADRIPTPTTTEGHDGRAKEVRSPPSEESGRDDVAASPSERIDVKEGKGGRGEAISSNGEPAREEGTSYRSDEAKKRGGSSTTIPSKNEHDESSEMISERAEDDTSGEERKKTAEECRGSGATGVREDEDVPRDTSSSSPSMDLACSEEIDTTPVLQNPDVEEEGSSSDVADADGVAVEESDSDSDSDSESDSHSGTNAGDGEDDDEDADSSAAMVERAAASSSSLPTVTSCRAFSGNVNGDRCDICDRGVVDGDANLLQSCRSCGVVVHEMCYGIAHRTSRPSRNWECLACDARHWKPVVAEVEDERTGRIRTVKLRTSERPTECVLCSVQHGVHAMHPVYDTNGRDGRQVVLPPAEGRPRRLAWVHSLCAFYIGSHPRTRGSTYACDEDGAWSGEGVDGDGGGNNEEVDESEEDEGDYSNNNKLESTHHFVINHEPGWTGVIGKFRKLTCYVCGICPDNHRREEGEGGPGGGEVPAMALSIPIQCSAGDDRYEMAEVARRRRRRGGRCCRAMHVGCTRWGAMRKKTTEAGATEVYHMESGGYLGFHPGSHPNPDDDLRRKRSRSGLKAQDDSSGEEGRSRPARGDPITLCYCHTHATSLPSWLTGNSPKAAAKKKRAPKEDGSDNDDGPPRKRQRGGRRGRPGRIRNVGRRKEGTPSSSGKSLSATGRDDRDVAIAEQPNEERVPRPNEKKVTSSKVDSDARKSGGSRNHSSVDDDKLVDSRGDDEGGEEVDSITSLESKESCNQAKPDGKSVEQIVAQSEDSDEGRSPDRCEEQPHDGHISCDDVKEGDGGEERLRIIESLSITDESAVSPSSGARRTKRKISGPIHDVHRSPKGKECPICHRHYHMFGYHQHYASCKKFQHWRCDGCGCDRDSFRPQKTEVGPNGKDTLCHDCGSEYRKDMGAKRWTAIKRTRVEKKTAPASVSVGKEVDVVSVRRSRRIRTQEDDQVASWMKEYADLERVSNEGEQEDGVDGVKAEVKSQVVKSPRNSATVRRVTRSAMANVLQQSEGGKYESKQGWQWLDAEEIALLLVVLLKGKYIIQHGAGEWIYTSVGNDLDLVRGDGGGAAPTRDEILTKWNELMSRSTGNLLSDSSSRDCARHVMTICLDDMIHHHNTPSPDNLIDGTRAASLVHAGWQMVTVGIDVAEEGQCVRWRRPNFTPSSSLWSKKQKIVSSGLSLADAWKEHTSDLRAKLEHDLSSLLGQKPGGRGQYLVKRVAPAEIERKLENEEHIEAGQDYDAEASEADDETNEDKIEEEKRMDIQHDTDETQEEDDIGETEALGMTRTYSDLLMDGLIPAKAAKRLRERFAYVIKGDPRPFPDCCWCGPKWSHKRTKDKKVNGKDSNKPSCRACKLLYHDGWRMFAVRRQRDGCFDHSFKSPEGKNVPTAKQFLKDTTHYVAELLAEEQANSRSNPKRKARTMSERQRKKQHTTKQDPECVLERVDSPHSAEAQTKKSSMPVFKNKMTEKPLTGLPPIRLPTIEELLVEKGGLHGFLAVDEYQTWRYAYANEMDIAAQVLETLTSGELPSTVQQETPFLRSKEEVLSLSSEALAPVTRFFGTTRIVEERILGVEKEMIRIRSTPTGKFGVEFPVFHVDEASVNGCKETQRPFPPRAASVAGHKVLLRMDITTEILAGQLYTFVYRLLFGSAAVEEVMSRINPEGNGVCV